MTENKKRVLWIFVSSASHVFVLFCVCLFLGVNGFLYLFFVREGDLDVVVRYFNNFCFVYLFCSKIFVLSISDLSLYI